MFIVVSVCWTTWKTPSLSPPLRRGIGRGRGTPVFCHASQEPRNEWNYSWLFSMLTRAQQRGSTKSSSTWRGWLPPGQSWPARRPVTWTRASTRPTIRRHLAAGDAWRSTMIPMRCRVKGDCLHPVAARVWRRCDALYCPWCTEVVLSASGCSEAEVEVKAKRRGRQ